MTESAEALAANQKARRNITIEIANLTHNYCLLDPEVFLDSGNVHSPPQPTVRPLKTEVCNFTKSGGKASGVVGLLSYKLYQRGRGRQGQVVLMFSVPYDYNLYENWMGLAFYQNEKIDKTLFNKMYHAKQVGFIRHQADGSMVNLESDHVDLKATMSPMGRCMIKIEIWDGRFFGTPNHWTKCK